MFRKLSMPIVCCLALITLPARGASISCIWGSGGPGFITWGGGYGLAGGENLTDIRGHYQSSPDPVFWYSVPAEWDESDWWAEASAGFPGPYYARGVLYYFNTITLQHGHRDSNIYTW